MAWILDYIFCAEQPKGENGIFALKPKKALVRICLQINYQMTLTLTFQYIYGPISSEIKHPQKGLGVTKDQLFVAQASSNIVDCKCKKESQKIRVVEARDTSFEQSTRSQCGCNFTFSLADYYATLNGLQQQQHDCQWPSVCAVLIVPILVLRVQFVK